MPASSIDAVRFIFDEDARGFGRHLAEMRSDMACVGSDPIADAIPLGMGDPEWIPIAAKAGWVVITKNTAIRTHPREAVLAIEAGLRVACLMEPRRNANRWDFARLVLQFWDHIESLATVDGPAWRSVYASRVMQRDFKPGQPPRPQHGSL